MKLYRLKTLFIGKDLYHEALLGHGVFPDDRAVFDFLHDNYYLIDEDNYEDEESDMGVDIQEIINAQGNYESDFDGEFYDQKFRWEFIKDITLEEANVLCDCGILKFINCTAYKYGLKKKFYIVDMG